MSRLERLFDEIQRLIEASRPVEHRKSTVADRIAAAARASAKRNPRRKPPEAGIAAPAELPRGPLPKTGGAEAPLTFD